MFSCLRCSSIEKLNKHDQYVAHLCDELTASGYDRVTAHVELFSKRKRRVAEVDVVATKGARCDIFEVKCSHRITKARKQLIKIKKLINKPQHLAALVANHRAVKNINVYFYCGESGAMISV